MTPQEYLSEHSLTKRLLKYGISDQELSGLTFIGADEAFEFDLWPFTWDQRLISTQSSLVKAYCALKWLLLEEHLPSPNVTAAQTYVSQVCHHLELGDAFPTFEVGLSFRVNQSKRAKNRRARRVDGGQYLDGYISKLAHKYRELSANELWEHFKSALDNEGLVPREIIKNGKRFVSYRGQNCDSNQIALTTFQRKVSEFRRPFTATGLP